MPKISKKTKDRLTAAATVIFILLAGYAGYYFAVHRSIAVTA